MKILENKTITDVPYFKAIGIHCGVKKKRKDLCIIYSEKKSVAAGTFTTNKVKAAPVILNMENIKSFNTQAIVVNSGNANACTGDEGLNNAYTMATTAADCLGLSPEEVLIASTGIIGVPLPMNIIIPGIKKACDSLSYTGGESAAEAIMTTDTFTKKITVEIEIDGKNILISGISKGSGMIHPNMATMLSFVVSDVNISKEMLSKALKDSVEDSYNMISVDGDTSTNDMVIAMANGSAQNSLIDNENDDFIKFKEALDFVNKELAKMIAMDGEGATKLIEVSLYNAKTVKDAKLCAKSVISSSLVKSAFFGSDANWGRILCALGYSDGEFYPEKIDIFFKNDVGTVQLVENGKGLCFNEELAKDILDQKNINITIDLKDGEYSATAWGCDLTYDYVKINGSYRS
ncbi:bifunctional glutamate N-acetyltransferase/amino-acid acetyltransferase ArgJ [Romboutsia sp.]|uniref:bifunctional glutamate N-acetyltransferase/amino-acid acetyltransferase ArgJ n=1 Tax=Romboutsia sp. TaxID=1965302 RepID=UPI002C34EDBA|nr:bifunctional glutamate N-acetyltransferase/amino-acid acetyltransferase ArgJ [Romboutsia sp.]HSQ88660.1 bifunctional glutamate N-acetyltransferase/amino-acid acetyltransferase ArgJ [Romboutsia sp.]